jgi:hypothetical protein
MLIDMGIIDMRGKLYQPSNGTEGGGFLEHYCTNCFYDEFSRTGNENDRICDIISRAMCFDLSDPGYPKEWIFGENNRPTCTKFRDYTKGEPEVIDPKQINLFGGSK